MITAVDTNILLDIFFPDKRFAEGSAGLLRIAYDEGALLICEVVYAELVPQFKKRNLLDETLGRLNISISSLDLEAAFLAGEKWGQYRESGGKRERIITDFLIGAHAFLKADRFLTRDRGFYRSYFPNLPIFDTLP
jgi:predicted nucleic acid-binding protein